MYFYYFMLKRYRHRYQQLNCILKFSYMFLSVAILTAVIRPYSSFVFQSLLFLGGWCTWTFIEYILHRFWMHSKNSNSSMAQSHHHHHTHPTEFIVTDVHRLSMVILLTIFIVIAVYLDNFFTYLTGVFFGITGYFFLHRFLHLKIGQKVFRKLFRYHIYHHCKYPNTCFGISVPWWDDFFKTVPKEPKISHRIIDFYFNEHKEKPAPSLLKPSTVPKGHVCGMNSCQPGCRSCTLLRKTAMSGN